ncbi:MAG: plastocyanin/azurin family copper-binding protein [Candidatus Methylomirabilia bacterium]
MSPPEARAPQARVPPSGPSHRRWPARVGLWLLIMGVGFPVWQPRDVRAESAPGSRKAAVTVVIKHFEFVPQTVTVAAGGTVRWISQDIANHQITTGVVDGKQLKPDGRVSSALLFRGDEFSATFTTAGTYPYYCAVHPFMRGTIVVK